MTESLEDVIQKYRLERQSITEKSEERQRLYQLQAQNYLKSLKNEIDTIKHAEPFQKLRNREFRDQIQSLFLRQEVGTERLRMAMQKTLLEKNNYNTYLLSVYPKEFNAQKNLLEEENRKIKQQIFEIKQGEEENHVQKPKDNEPNDMSEDGEPTPQKIPQHQHQRPEEKQNDAWMPPPSNKTDKIDQFVMEAPSSKASRQPH